MAAHTSAQEGHALAKGVGLGEDDGDEEAVTDDEAESEGVTDADAVADTVAVGDAVGVGVQNAAQAVLATRQSHEAGQPFRVVVCMPLFPGGQPPAVPFSVSTAGCIGSLGSKRALAAATCSRKRSACAGGIAVGARERVPAAG